MPTMPYGRVLSHFCGLYSYTTDGSNCRLVLNIKFEDVKTTKHKEVHIAVRGEHGDENDIANS